MKTETERIAQLARAYGVQCIGASRGVSSYKDQSVALENLLAAIESLVAERAALAAGKYIVFRRDGTVVMGLPDMNAVREAAATHHQPAATATGEEKPSKPPAVPAATAEPASAIAVADQATEEWQWRDAEDRATQPEPAKPEPTDLRTLVEDMNHCVDAAIGSLIGAARDKNLLTIDALRAIARVVEELAKEAK